MRPSVLTVVTAADWEGDLVAAARTRGLVRVVGRCRNPFEVEERLAGAQALVIGAETAWLSSALIRRWRAAGTTVIGMVEPGDRPGAELLAAGGVDAILPHTEPPGRVLTAIVSTAGPSAAAAVDTAATATVVGPRGAPGRTEVALALAWAAAGQRRTLLVELDSDAPGLGLRLGLEPGPGLDRCDPALGVAPLYRRCDRLELLTLPPGVGPLSRSLSTRVVESAKTEFGCVVIDAGPTTPGALGMSTGTPVLVVEPTPTGLVRTARMVAGWDGPPPLLIANRTAVSDGEAVRAIRSATGLEPVAIIPELPVDWSHAAPAPGMIEALEATLQLLLGSGPTDRLMSASL